MQAKPKNANRFFANLLRAVPEFQDRLAEHLGDNKGLLPFPALDDFARFLIGQFQQFVDSAGTDGAALDVFRRGVSFLEDARKKDEATNTLIRSTFVDTVQTYWRDKRMFEKLLAELGSGLRADVLDGLRQ